MKTAGRALTGIILAVMIGLSRFGCHYAEFSQAPGARIVFLLCLSVLLFGTPFALGVFFFAGFKVTFEKGKRLRYLVDLSAAGLALWLFNWAAGVEWDLRREAFGVIARRSAPLISAIQSYEQAEGKLPANLGALVPRYLPEIPETGISTRPEYDYRVIEPLDERGRWRLCVYSFPFRTFCFNPTGNHGSEAFYLIEGWAYLGG